MPRSGDIALEAAGLVKEFRGFRAVDDVSLSITAGSIHALIGPNGAGKTTVFNLLTKTLQPTRGSIRLFGADITREAPHLVARRGMARSFQITSTFNTMTVRENIDIALRARLLRDDPALGTALLEADELIGEYGGGLDPDAFVDRLSYGRKRTVEILTTIAANPSVILLDEPTQGMGAEDIQRTANLIRAVAKERTVVIVEHNLKVVAELADEVTVLQRGRILACGTYEMVAALPEVQEAYLGEPEQ